MKQPLRVLIVEDSQEDAELLLRELQHGGYAPISMQVDTPESMNAALDEKSWDIVISDHRMPHFSAPAALKLLQEKGVDIPFIIVSGVIGEDIAVEAMKSGAHDYLMKGDLARLLPAIERELKEAGERRQRKRAEAKIRHLAYYDALTDLPNRTLLFDRLQQAILVGQRENKSVALLMMDLDRFKEVNDSLGHYAGDFVLQQIGPRIRNVLRTSDTIARFGGDEFGILLPDGEDAEQATLVARKILKVLEEPFVLDDMPLEVGASIGIAIFPEHGDSAELLSQRADVAMYTAKKGGGHAVYEPECDKHRPFRLTLISELRHAIDSELMLFYQPKVSIQTRMITGAEALLRWQHPQHGLMLPSEFIPLVEETGLITTLGEWVLRTACAQTKAWQADGLPPLRVSVNLSMRQFQQQYLVDLVTNILKNEALSPHYLELELTESLLMQNTQVSIATLNGLHALGVAFSIDDFGTGYSSLSYLKRFPIDALKIDQSFVRNMTTDPHDAALATAMITMAHGLGIMAIAEGVETSEQWNFLQAQGCDEIQGHYFSEAIPATAFAQLLRENTRSGASMQEGVGSYRTS